MTGFLGCKCTLLGWVKLLINRHPQVLLMAALSPSSTQTVFVLRIAPTHVQDLALGLVELHEVCTGPALKPVNANFQENHRDKETTQKLNETSLP